MELAKVLDDDPLYQHTCAELDRCGEKCCYHVFGFVAIHQHVRASLLLYLLPRALLLYLCPARHDLKPPRKASFRADY
jgi:hypothetical protein